MKEIARLGKEANDAWIKSDDCGLCGDEFYSNAHDSEFRAGFDAGFRKCREMAAQRVKHFTIKTGWIGKNEYTGSTTLCESNEMPLSDVMLTLGESEVEG